MPDPVSHIPHSSTPVGDGAASPSTPGAGDTPRTDSLEGLRDALFSLRAEILLGGQRRLQRFSRDYPGDIPLSARNLAHYLAFRSLDLRPIQRGLARQGLSSLGRTEAHVLASINQVTRRLAQLTGHEIGALNEEPAIDYDTGETTLQDNADQLFGAPSGARQVRIMVTLPSAAAVNPQLVEELMEEGMDCARINCAHDGPQAWAAMLKHLSAAEAAQGRRCTVLMDLAGHKLRTGPLDFKPAITHIKPLRNLLGRVTEPAHVHLLPEASAQDPVQTRGQYAFSLPEATLERLQSVDELRFRDTRGKGRVLRLKEPLPGGGWLATLDQGAYVSDETEFVLERPDANGRRTRLESLRLGWLTREYVNIRLYKGCQLHLTRAPLPGRPAKVDDEGQVIRCAHIACSTPEALDLLEVGQPVWIDDGKIGGQVESVDESGMHVRITHCRPQGSRLRADKGLNFPGARLNLPPLSAQDLQDLDFVAAHADLVGYSFVESRQDMVALMDALACRGGGGLGVVAKIETRRALENLSEIILATLGRHRLGVMIARGDLAVEIGGERLAEIQEEILWLCEAAHVPVIWATQVLETLAKTGTISRPELTDAAMAGRAECVMLNKGPYILEAVHTLNDILVRMQAHQHKKSSQLRALRLCAD
ncbi:MULTISPECIES: pyruvate kinase [unclassified Ectothiorhodospira]|uniref:pyruvate kinase n=1 Tax=unclassified Ectothiorhodospira TaxID=2684909 RepID=UPI001EE94970|nr:MULTISPECIES: pyruvate kinase [unclassified Ectothiorhodospira]MCG5516996.1 pyruvate kinase [Ectothiorhodospira sp. 9100]MCG5519203.1 pyruvate kinase [Ectothiorhodospira sp. 9905]